MYEPSLLLSPHVFLLAILYRHRAFKSERLNDNLGILYSLKLFPGENELRLALKPDHGQVHLPPGTKNSVRVRYWR